MSAIKEFYMTLQEEAEKCRVDFSECKDFQDVLDTIYALPNIKQLETRAYARFKKEYHHANLEAICTK